MAFLDYSQLGRVIPNRNKEEVRACCPYCNDESFHLYVNTRKQVFNCFRCGAKGRTNLTSHLQTHAEHFGYDDKRVSNGRTWLQLPSPIAGTLTPAAERYLSLRGLKESDCVRHKIYCADSKSIYFGRVIIPCDPRPGMKCRYFTARAYTKLAWPKYLNPPGGKNVLYLSPKAPDEMHPQYWGEEELMLVEGPFDMLKASRHGPTAALLGKQLSDDVAREIVSRFSKVYILLDRGIPEIAAAMQIQNKLSTFLDAQVLSCQLKDPGEMSPKDFEEMFKWH